MDTAIGRIAARVEALKARHADRDARMKDVRSVRMGNFDEVAPDLFSEEWPRSIVANLIDTSANAAAGALAPLPTVTCRSGSSTSDRAREWSDKRTKIARNYIQSSDLAGQNHTGADQYFTYGLMVTCVDPDFDKKLPRISHEDSIGVYPVWNRSGDTIEVARVFTRTVVELLAEYPEHESRIRRAAPVGGSSTKLEVVKYVDAKQIILYCPQAQNLVLEATANPLKRCYYVCTKRPGLDAEIRGAYDDLIWVQLARHSLQIYALEAAAKSVQAPLVVPQDVGDVPMGADAIIRTQQGAGSVGRVNLQVPPQVFQGIDMLKTEMLTSAVVPPSPGSIDASVITGAGVRELSGGYSQQIATAQLAFISHFKRVLSLAFEMDEKFWPEVEKSLRGQVSGVPYDEKYKSGRDIKGDYTVEISYGFQAGLDANRALVLILQAQGAGLVSKDFARRGLPGDINATEEETKIHTEQMREAILQGLLALSNGIPTMVTQGQDPTELVRSLAEVTNRLQKGEYLEDVVEKVFAPKPAPEEEGAPPAEEAPLAPPAEDPMAAMGGMNPDGSPPSLQKLFAGISSSGQAQLSGGVSQQRPAM